MDDSLFISKKELVAQLGISKSTYRQLRKKLGIETDMKKLITKVRAEEIKSTLQNYNSVYIE